jgi:hypothetical protein
VRASKLDHVLIPASPHADFLFLIVDGSSIYTAQNTRQSLAQRPQIVLVPLPSYAPHLNLQEQIWRWMRTAVTHNHFFETCAALITAALRSSPQPSPSSPLWRTTLKWCCGASVARSQAWWTIILQTVRDSH